MPYYQLANGKTIVLSIEQYLEMSDDDIQYMISIDFGEVLINPFVNSAITKNSKEKHYDFDYSPDDDDVNEDEFLDDTLDISDDE